MSPCCIYLVLLWIVFAYMLVFLLYFYHLLQNKWWVRLNNQALWDCICIACMFVFLLSTICLHLCVNYFSMCLLKVFLNLKKGIFRRRVRRGQRMYCFVILNFFIHHHRWWSLVHWGPLSLCWVSFLVPQNILNWHLCLWQGHCLSTFSWQALLHCIFFKPPEICIFQNTFRDMLHFFSE